ncbi:MAG TPA: hypothetical protein VM029_08840 [Opitutaceae bacterium]|nr:hypothetical protein [Opitutaceae bacterium]
MAHSLTRPIPRRTFLETGALAVGALATARVLGAEKPAVPAGPKAHVTARDMLRGLLYTKKEVDEWLAGKAFPFAKYSSEYGWLLRPGRVREGVDKSVCVYTFGPLDERITINYRDRPCRINTYGNSYTQCHQVSDGETWQEALAAHLQEPLRNFGVGGWSVYQAYLRMLREEQRAPAEFIVFNIYEDDHFRNLDSWRNIRAKKHVRFIEPTLPHVVVNAEEQRFDERPNPCPTPASVYHLTDLDWVEQQFKDDFALRIMLAHANATASNPEQAYADINRLATTHGIITRVDTGAALSKAAEALHCRTAYFSSMRIVEKIETYARQTGKRVLYVLSGPARNIAQFVSEGVRRDQPFVDFMRAQKLPFVDLLDTHVRDFASYKGDIKDYLARHFIGHYNPRGNFFCAQAIKGPLVQMLDPKPVPYRSDSEV